MEKQIKKNRSGLRTAGKVFGIIDIVLASIILLGGIAMIVVSVIITNKVGSHTGSEAESWLALASTLNLWGIICTVEGPLMLAFSIVGLKLVTQSESFIAMLIFGIVNVIIGGAAILGIIMIVVACIECYPKFKNKK